MGSKYTANLSRLLDTLLELPPERRGAWLDALGDEFAALKPRLRKLIARSGSAEAGGLLATLPKLETHPDVHAFPEAAQDAGAIVGPYQLARRLGAGAMGTVWLAQRTDGAPPREVALKFAHLAPAQPTLPARFAREQQLLAALDHPNIARMYAAGVTGAGQPYLVLEYIPGLLLDEYCRSHPLTTLQRLELFLQIARAVAHAHNCQIVHRDLKPANVMVGRDGAVRLLDFGIGKLLNDDLPPEMQLSRLHGQPLTPAYASPEQLMAADVGLPSDVYSLGVLLFELLTGQRPYQYRRGSSRELRQAILEAVPLPPSRKLLDPAINPAWRPKLDAIVLKALEKRPDKRYADAGELTTALESLHAI